MSFRSEDDMSCPICQEIFKEPVVLSCSHSFCKACLQRWWTGNKQRDCPCCKRRSSKSDPPRNLALKNLCEAFLMDKEQKSSSGSGGHCSQHSERLTLFCLDHQQPVCLVCRDSRIHSGHKFSPIDEAAQDHRDKLQKYLKPLQQKFKVFEEVRGNCEQTAEHIKVQARHTERQIKEQFKKLHQFLQDEEEARISALRDEEDSKSQLMKEKIDVLIKEIKALSETIRSTEKELEAGDISFLQNYKAAVEKVQQRPLLGDPELDSGALIDTTKHLGNLAFLIWNKMKKLVSYSPVILDPNTADPELIVSEDLTSVRAGEQRQLPKNPKRTKFSCSVLGSEGYNSGTHSWDVEVGNNKDWELGMLADNIWMNGRLQSVLWRIMLSEGKLTVFSTTGPEKDMVVKNQLQRIRVHLDFEGGKLSFSDLDTNTHLHTFTYTFTGTIFPYLYTENHVPLKVLPVKVKVMVEKLK